MRKHPRVWPTRLERDDMGKPTTCGWCGAPLTYKGAGRPPLFCSVSCKQRRYAADDPVRKQGYNRTAYAKKATEYAQEARERRAANPEASREANRRYYEKNKASWDKYRGSRSLLFRPEDLEYTTWLKTRARFEYFGWRCWMCGAPLCDETVTRDHVKPLTAGGRHLPCNIRPACQPCNSIKNNNWPYPLGRAVRVADLVAWAARVLESASTPLISAQP